MAKLKDVSSVIAQIQRELNSIRFSRELGDKARDVIFKRTKSGRGVSDDRAKEPRKVTLKVLSPATVKQRTRSGVSGSFSRPSKSNLTDTGQLLDSIQVIAGPGEFQLIIPNTQRRKKGNERRTPTNAEVAEFVSEDRPFFALTGDEQNILRREVTDRMRKIIRRLT